MYKIYLCNPQVPPEQQRVPAEGHLDFISQAGEPETAAENEEICLSTALCEQLGQTGFSEADLTSFSKKWPHSGHLYSNMGM